MKKHLMILAAVATLACGCNKLNDSISKLEERIDNSESNIELLNERLDNIQSVLNQISAGISIKGVSAIDGGFSIEFSDGSKYDVVNGEDCEVSYTEDSLCYYFDFGDGNVIAVPKAGAFGINVENDAIELQDGGTVKIPYEVVGADDATKVIVEDNSNYKVTVNDDEIVVSADKVVAGSFVVKAIRNTDGASSAVVITVTRKAVDNVTFEITVSDISQFGAIVTVVPSNNNVYYYLGAERASYVNQFDTDDELYQDDIDYFYEKYGTSYSDYGFSSFEELFTEGLCYKGEKEFEIDSFDAGTDYVVYAYAVDDDLSRLTDPIARENFTTEEEEELDATFIGIATWHEGICNTWFNFGDLPVDLPVDVYEDNYMPGVYYFDSPYNYVNIAPWFGCTPEEMQQYTANYRKATICIDASNPDKVHMAFQSLGVCLDPDYGWVSGGTQYPGLPEASTGTFKDGVIAFTGDLYAEMSKYNPGDPDTNTKGQFYITMPDVEPSAAVNSVHTTMEKYVSNTRRAADKLNPVPFKASWK